MGNNAKILPTGKIEFKPLIDGEGDSHDAVYLEILHSKGMFIFVTAFDEEDINNGIASIDKSGAVLTISIS